MTKLESKDYILKKIRKIFIEDITTGQIISEIKNITGITLNAGQDKTEVLGTDGAKLAIFDKAKSFNIKATSGTISTGYLELQVGSDFQEIKNSTGAKITRTLVTADGTTVTLPHKAVGAVGNEIGFIYKDNKGSVGKAYEQSSNADGTHFKYDPSNKQITLPTSVFQAGDKVIVSYFPEFTTAEKLVNRVNDYSKTGKVYVDAYFTKICDQKDEPLQLVVPMGKISGVIDWQFGDNAAVQNIDIEALASPCSEDSELFILHKYLESNIKAD